MRIVLDLQGAQTTGSRHRGIGRYTLALAQAIARQAGGHEVLLALNGLFPETVEPIRATFDGLVPQENIRVWQTMGPVRELEPANAWRCRSAEYLREAFLTSLKPDVVHVSSLFEGSGDDAVTSIGTFKITQPTAVTLYDLIPLLYREKYLCNPAQEAWYERKLHHMRRAQLWLAISESSRREGIEYLGLPDEWVFNISTAADAQFRPVDVPDDRKEAIGQRYGLVRPFVMYTGGIDHRKNIEGLIRAYAALPENTRSAHQLAVVCSIQPEIQQTLERLAKSRGVAPGEVIFTGFVPDEELVELYNLCQVFAFPSWHEGFGLPALEAMCCGAAVIGSNSSSLPEVIGREDALFDPYDDAAITARLQSVLVDESFRTELKRHGLRQATKFSWGQSAKAALEAFERLHQVYQQPKKFKAYYVKPCRPRLAYISPLPPEKSGIADYSAELLPELARHYEIDVIVDQQEITTPWISANCNIHSAQWFSEHAHRYERVLYHFGNSSFHQHMFSLLEQHPGVVVLHDFFLSGILSHVDVHGFNPYVWVRELYLSHGYHAVRERFHATDSADVVWKYPCNLSVLQQAKGVIIHSDFSQRLVAHWYGTDFAKKWNLIPLLRSPAQALRGSAARKVLGLQKSDFVVCSFGLLGPMKLNHRLLEAWLASPLSKNKDCRLVFVGENHSGEYGANLLKMIHSCGCAGRVQITGFVPREQYRDYLAAADVAVQLRTLSRGETSAAVLDCMNYGLPTVVNAHGSMSDLPEDCVVMLPDEFTERQLAQMLESLWRDHQKRRLLGERARAYITKHHTPRQIGDRYAQAIENFYNNPATVRDNLIQSLAALEGGPGDEASWLNLARAVAENLPLPQPKRQLLLDVSELVQNDNMGEILRVVRSVLKELLVNPPAGFRVEPIYAVSECSYQYARRFTLNLLDCPGDALTDEPVELNQGDIFLGLNLHHQIGTLQKEFLAKARRLGIGIFFLFDFLPVHCPDYDPSEDFELPSHWLSVVAQADGALCISRKGADKLSEWLDETQPERHRPFNIGWFHLGDDIGLTPLQAEPALDSEGMPWQTWAESTKQIMGLLTDSDNPNWIHHWMPHSSGKGSINKA